jgi:hypothetical protein
MGTRLKNPHQRAILTLVGLVSFSLLTTLAILGFSSAGLANPALLWVSFIFFVVFGLIFIIVWLLGISQMRRARAFLASDRPLVSWTYSAVEWQQLKENLWQEEKGDWKVQWGCLTLLLALAGLLTGIMLGLGNDFLELIVNSLIGLVLGGLFGGAIGALVAGGNYWGARKTYQRSEPGQVAIGPNEIYASDDYFKGDGVISYIQEAKIQRGNPITLELQLVFPPRPRMPIEEQWTIPVPPQWVAQVEEILPILVGPQESLSVE